MISVEAIDRDNRTCSICTDTYSDHILDGAKIPMKLPCGHILDLSCLLNWLLIDSAGHLRNTCPMCRMPVFPLMGSELKIDVRHLRRVLFTEQIDDERLEEGEEDEERILSQVFEALFSVLDCLPTVVILLVAAFALFEVGNSILQMLMDAFDPDRQYEL